MNKRQSIVLFLGALIIVLMGLFPPTLYGDYQFLFEIEASIDIIRLLVQWVVVAVVVGGLIYILRNKKKTKERIIREKISGLNLRRGFKRIVLVLSIAVSLFCAIFAVNWVFRTHRGAKGFLQWCQENYSEKYEIAATKEQLLVELNRREALSPQDRAVEEKQRQPRVEEKAIAMSKLEELQKGFWVNLSTVELIGMVVLYGLGGAVAGYLGTWVILWFGGLAIYGFLRWLVLGFCSEEVKSENTKQIPEPTRKH